MCMLPGHLGSMHMLGLACIVPLGAGSLLPTLPLLPRARPRPAPAVSAADGSVLWAASFGGAVGPDAAFDLGFNPLTGDVLVSGAFSKNAVFGPDHAASASVNNVLQAEGAFVASLTAAEGAVNWVSSFPVDAEVSGRLYESLADWGLDCMPSAHGSPLMQANLDCRGAYMSARGEPVACCVE